MNDNLENVKFNPELSYVVVHQIDNNRKEHYRAFIERISKTVNLKYIQVLDKKGLSLSRNIAIENSDSKYIVFSDDDNYYVDDLEIELFKVIESLDEPDFISFKIEDDNGNSFKRYERKVFSHDKSSLLRISSIENVVKLDFLLENNIRFNEDFGLGAKFPSCEQPIFLNDILECGGKAYFYPMTITFHPLVNSGDDFYSKENARTRRELFKKLYGKFKGNIFCFLFLLKKINAVPKSHRYFFAKDMLGWRI